MPSALNSLPKFVPIVVRHFAAYLELFADDATELGSRTVRRIVAAVVMVMAFCFALAIACVWILSAVWDTPWRQFAIVGLLLAFAVAAMVAWFVAARQFVADWSPFHRLRGEWNLDRQLIMELEVMSTQYRESKYEGSTSEQDTATSPSHV